MEVVAKYYIERANSNVGNASFFSSVEGGDFELSVYLTSPGGSSGTGTVTFTATWGDRYGNQQNSSLVLAVGSSGVSSAGLTIPLRMFQGSAIGWSTAVVTLPTGAEYSVYVCLKDLSAPQL